MKQGLLKLANAILMAESKLYDSAGLYKKSLIIRNKFKKEQNNKK